jgi:hypothetical protein
MIAALTSAAPRQRAIMAGWRSISAFHTARAVWYALSVGMIICPVDVPRNSSKADPSTCVMAELLVADATHSEELAS